MKTINFLGNAYCSSQRSVYGISTVTAQIVDEYGEPVPFVSVFEKDTTNGVMADENGVFTIDVPTTSILSFSYSTTVTDVPVLSIGNTVTINTALQGDEVVVTAPKPSNLKFFGYALLAGLLLAAIVNQKPKKAVKAVI